MARIHTATEQRKEICPQCGKCHTRLLYWSEENHEVGIREFAESSDEITINFPFYIEKWECTRCRVYDDNNSGEPLIFSVMLKTVWRDTDLEEYNINNPGNQTEKVVKDWIRKKHKED